jgi:hypothetical protein
MNQQMMVKLGTTTTSVAARSSPWLVELVTINKPLLKDSTDYILKN